MLFIKGDTRSLDYSTDPPESAHKSDSAGQDREFQRKKQLFFEAAIYRSLKIPGIVLHRDCFVCL